MLGRDQHALTTQDKAVLRSSIQPMTDARYDPSTTLVVVDVQNDFADPEGSLYVTGGEDVVPVINGEITAAATAGCRVVYTADWHPESTPHFVTGGGIWPVHCVGGSWGAKFHSELAVDGPVIKKGTDGEDGYSGFSVADPLTGDTSPTRLASLLAEWGTTKLVITGLATDYCVKATALDGRTARFEVVVLTDAIRSVDLQVGDGERALDEIVTSGGVLE